MYIQSLSVCNFRNYALESFVFSQGVNLILGENAQGKTNILEAITALSAVRSSRPPLRQDAIRFEAEFAEVIGEIYHDTIPTKLSFRLSRQRKVTEIYKNDVRQKRMMDIHGVLRVVSFCPDDLHLIRAGAVQRRNFLDRALSQISPRYGDALSKFDKCLSQKNAILKAQEEKPSLLDALDDYTIQLCHYGAQIVLSRAKYCQQLMQAASVIHAEIAPQERLSAHYDTVSVLQEQFPQLAKCSKNSQSQDCEILRIKEADLPTLVEVRTALLDYALRMRPREIAARSTLVGPHKDDLVLHINERSAAEFGSQGQVRTAALSLKMAEREVSFAQDGVYPVLLLDDVLSELDHKRQDFILNQVKHGQVFITACDPVTAGRFDQGSRFTIAEGKKIQSVIK